MNDADLELHMRTWLQADAAAITAPGMLRRRVLDIPAQPATTTHWWHRFATLPGLSAGVLTAGVLGILVANMFFGAFDAPAGGDGETCNNRQVQGALDRLRDADGYRFTTRQQLSEFDPTIEISFEDPEYTWTDAWLSEGAYLAPDRARDVRDPTSRFELGYIDLVQINGQTFQLRTLDGEEGWVRTTNWPTANLVYGSVQHVFPMFSIPGLTSLDLGGTGVPDVLPGTGGCTAAALVPDSFEGPAGFEVQKAVALRIDVASGRPMAIYVGPNADAEIYDGIVRTTYELDWTTPSPEEFQAPTEFIEDPDVAGGIPPPPAPSAVDFGPSAWRPVELPIPDLPGGRATVMGVAGGDGTFVAVGSSLPPNGEYGDERAVIWTSLDGASWEMASAPDDFDGMYFERVAWDGSTYVAIGRRIGERLDDGSFSSEQPETWLSDDGTRWERGGTLDPNAFTGELVPGGPGWVMVGGITSADNQIRPAIFTSPDARRWTTVDLPGVASGQLSVLSVDPDGGLLATGCESPGATNSHTTGNLCLMRPWRSEDGTSWNAGPLLGAEIHDIQPAPDGFVGIGRDVPAGSYASLADGAKFMTSAQGDKWVEVPSFPSAQGFAAHLNAIGDGFVVDGQLQTDVNYPIAIAWRSGDGRAWETIHLGLPEGADGSFVGGAVQTPAGLAFIGTGQIGDAQSVPVLWLEP